MVVNQRDVLLLNHSFDAKDDPHPFIILSVNEANQQERTFVGVMITSSEKTKDDFSFELNSNMFTNPLKKENSHVRMLLITSSFNESVIQKINTMKIYPFNQLIKSIGDLVFNFDFSPLN